MRWNVIRAAFLLLAIVVLIAMLESLVVVFGCAWLIVVEMREPLGSCADQGQQVRQVITELIAAILAIIIAARPPAGPPDE